MVALPMTHHSELIRKCRDTRKQVDAEAEELRLRFDSMRSVDDLCNVMSEIIASGIEKANESTDGKTTYKDLASYVVLIHK